MRRRAVLTLSGLQHADLCPGSVALPRFGRKSAPADRGTALHEYNALLGKEGRLAADEAADGIAERLGLEGKDRAIFYARARALDLQIPEEALYEVPLCLRADGTVEPAEGGQGSYHVPEDAIVAGTLDIVFATPAPIVDGRCPADSVLWTPDLKTGSDGNVAPIARNMQARAAALLGARYWGAEMVVPAIVYPFAGGGRWDVPMRGNTPVPLDARELALIEEELRDLAARAAEQVRRVEAGKLPVLNTGAHCTYCAARSGCPAHVAEVRALVTGQAGLAAGPLTPAQAERAAGLLGPARAALDAMSEALKVYVREHGPIPLPGGKVYGPRAEERQDYDTRGLYQALRADLDPLVGEAEGARLADGVFKASKDAVYDAIGEAHAAAGLKRQKGAAFDRITTRQVRASHVQVEPDHEHPEGSPETLPPEVVTAWKTKEDVSVAFDDGVPDRDALVSVLPPEDVERRWPVIVSRVATPTTIEKFTVHYPKEHS